MSTLATGLLARSLCQTTPFAIAQQQTTRHVRALQPEPSIHFGVSSLAHASGVNALVLDRFEGRFLVTGAADGGISMWDMQAGEESVIAQEPTGSSQATQIFHKAIASCIKSPATHSYGITSLQFYPFDSLAFLSSSYDHTLKLWSSTTLIPYASFSLSSVIYSAAISPVANHLLVACATQHPAVRLVDLRSGAAAHSLAGHQGGSVLSVSWSPKHEYIISSGGTDGTVRLWDVRQSAGCLGTLDLEDSVGIFGSRLVEDGSRSRDAGKAHLGPVNGILWTDDARHIITTGHDEKIRVWDAHIGANTLVNFGPKVRNRNSSTLMPILAPKGLLATGKEILFFPNDKEVLVFEMFEGMLLKRLKLSNLNQGRVTALAWRAHAIEMLSAHGDGTVRSWRPRTQEEALADVAFEAESQSQKRKRNVLEDIERDLTARHITFT